MVGALAPVRTAFEVVLEFVVFTRGSLQFQRIADGGVRDAEARDVAASDRRGARRDSVRTIGGSSASFLRLPRPAPLRLHPSWWAQLPASLVRYGDAAIVLHACDERRVPRSQRSTNRW